VVKTWRMYLSIIPSWIGKNLLRPTLMRVMLGVQRMEEPFTLVCDGVFF